MANKIYKALKANGEDYTMLKTLEEHLKTNGLTASYIMDETGETFGEMDIDGRRYPVGLSLSLGLSDDLCNSICIDGIRYYFSVYDY